MIFGDFCIRMLIKKGVKVFLHKRLFEMAYQQFLQRFSTKNLIG